MAGILLSEAEKTYILHGVRTGLRNDGRSCADFRPMELELGLVVPANGSARIRVANTDVLVSVKCEIESPAPERPNEGIIDFFVDCSANATPQFEGRGGEELATSLASLLARAYQSRTAFDLRPLCIIPGSKCWKLCVDVLVLECGGGLETAIALATKAALADTGIPRVSVVGADGGALEIELAEEGGEDMLIWKTAPCLVTLSKLEDSLVVDASAEEEACCAAALMVAVTPKGRITATCLPGHGSFLADSAALPKALRLAAESGKCLNEALHAAIEKHLSMPNKSQIPIGFLH